MIDSESIVLLACVLLAIVAAGLVLGLLSGQNRHREELAGLQGQNEQLRDELAGALKDKHTAEAQAAQLNELRETISQKETQLKEEREQISRLKVELAATQTRAEEESRNAEEKLKLLQEARQQLTQEFQNLANRIFDEKSEKFGQQNKQSLEGTLNPLREQLKDFRKKVEEVYEKDSKERVTLVAELAQLKDLNQQMSKEAINLTRALKGDNKAQGNWGEVILERVLEESGLHKGREYEVQVSLQTEDGRRRNPDVIVRLPENKDIVIDSKVSLVDYERYCSAEDPEERQTFLGQHAGSVKEHINRLSFKDYENLDGIRTLDFVFIFIPIEAAFMAAFEHDQAMFRDAYEKNIIVVGPTTLLATLRTVQSIWRYERQNRNAEEIARQAGALHDKFVGFINDLEDIGKHLDRAGRAHGDAFNKLSQGKGNLVNSTRKLEKLGAKVKKQIPESVSQEVEDEDRVIEFKSDS
jgi:DNA recombination protein RmuC